MSGRAPFSVQICLSSGEQNILCFICIQYQFDILKQSADQLQPGSKRRQSTAQCHQHKCSLQFLTKEPISFMYSGNSICHKSVMQWCLEKWLHRPKLTLTLYFKQNVLSPQQCLYHIRRPLLRSGEKSKKFYILSVVTL